MTKEPRPGLPARLGSEHVEVSVGAPFLIEQRQLHREILDVGVHVDGMDLELADIRRGKSARPVRRSWAEPAPSR